jgi:hypothetical protein
MKKIHPDQAVWEPNGDGSEMRWPIPGRWHRDDDPYARRLMTSGADGPESIQDDELFDELRQIIKREMSFIDEHHLVRLTVEIDMSH